MNRRGSFVFWLIALTTTLVVSIAGAGNYGMPGHGEKVSDLMLDQFDLDSRIAESKDPDDLVVESGNPDDRVVEAGDPDDHLAHSKAPDDLVVEAGNLDDYVVESRDVDELVINSVMSDAEVPASYGGTLSPEAKMTRDNLAEARAGSDVADARYSRMMADDYPRGEARRDIIEKRNEAARHLRRARELHRAALE
jgi:hypothetical protein